MTSSPDSKNLIVIHQTETEAVDAIAWAGPPHSQSLGNKLGDRLRAVAHIGPYRCASSGGPSGKADSNPRFGVTLGQQTDIHSEQQMWRTIKQSAYRTASASLPISFGSAIAGLSISSSAPISLKDAAAVFMALLPICTDPAIIVAMASPAAR
jgi:hypothetical protein